MKLTCITTTGKTANNGINLPLILGASHWAIAIAQLPACPWCLGLPSSRFPVPSSLRMSVQLWLTDCLIELARIASHRRWGKGNGKRETGMRPGTEPGCHQWNSLRWCCMLRPNGTKPARPIERVGPLPCLSSVFFFSFFFFVVFFFCLLDLSNGEWGMENGEWGSRIAFAGSMASWPTIFDGSPMWPLGRHGVCIFYVNWFFLLLLHSLYALRAAAIVVVVVQQPIVISYDGWCLKLFKYIQLI